MYSKELEELIASILADGVITDKERAVLHRRAEAEGVDADELDVLIEGRLAQSEHSAKECAEEDAQKSGRVLKLLEELEHIKRSTNDSRLSLLRMRAALWRFPLPDDQNEIVQFLTLGIPFTKRKSKSLFSSKREKENVDWHNEMVDTWTDICAEIILEARFAHVGDEQLLKVLEEFEQQLEL